MAGWRHLRWRRVAPSLAVGGAALALSGCFGGSTTTVQQTPSTPSGAGPGGPGLGGLSTTMVAKGPTDVTENITQLVNQHYDQLNDVHIQCPSDEPSPPNYPVHCTVTAIDTSKLSRRDQPDGKHRPITGNLSIYGVYPPTQTYAFQFNYQPNFALKPGFKPPKSQPKKK